MSVHSDHQHIRPVTWKNWIFWVSVCAVEPILYAIVSTAFNKPVLRSDPDAALVSWGLSALMLVCLPLPTLLQWSVLRQILPQMTLRAWIVGVIAAGAIYAACSYWHIDPNAISRKLSAITQGIRYGQAIDGVTRTGDVFQTPTLLLLLKAILVTSAIALIPSILLGRASGKQWFVFLVAACIGECASILTEQLYGLYFFRHDGTTALNNLGWVERLRELSLRAGTGAVWGAFSGTAFIFLNRDRGLKDNSPSKPGLLAAIFSILLIAPIFLYVTGDGGFRSGFPVVRKASTSTPSKDQSSGESVLEYSHTADFSAPPYPVMRFAPDGKSFIALASDRTLQRIDIASGKRLGQIAEPLGQHASYTVTWSPGGRFLALRTDGEEVKTPGTVYSKHRNRYRIYSLPEYQLVGDLEYKDAECFSSYGQQLVFENSGNSVWVRCAQNYTSPKKAEDIIAVRIAVPTMQILDVVRYNERAAEGEIDGLGNLAGHVVYWKKGDKTGNLSIRSLPKNQDLLRLQGLNQSNLAGGLIFQELAFENDRVKLRYCGNPSAVSDPGVIPHASTSGHTFCRTLAFTSPRGALIEKQDDTPSHTATATELPNAKNQIRVTASFQQDSKAGEIIVRDYKTKRELQRITAQSQRLLTFSPEGQWLATKAINENTLRIYRVRPSSGGER